MKTDPNTSPQAEHIDVGHQKRVPVSTMRRAGQVGLSIINPFSDFVVIYRKGVQPTLKKLSLAREMLAQRPAVGESLNWEEAVRRAGVSVEQLQKSYSRIRAVWWCLMTVTGVLSITLLGMLLVTQFNLPSGTLVRALLATVTLASLGGVGFVKVLGTNYRLWQLTERRVSEAEHGTFRDFIAESRWFRQVLTMGMVR